ncbi:MAG: fibronectin type III domain-containing protein [Verrucomicrobiota bacterium]|nr:fibronectin type III domain-containing protein [Verrucomicrobiota bacterium]
MRLALNSSRLQWTSALIALLLQRAPVVKVIAEAQFAGPSRVIQVWQWVIASVVGLSAYDAYAGPTTIAASPSGAINGETETNVAAVVTVSPFPSEAWIVTGALPPGVNYYATNNGTVPLSGTNVPSGTKFVLQSRSIFIRGKPTSAGKFTVTTTAWEHPNLTGGNQTATIVFTITPKAQPLPQPPANLSASDAVAVDSITVSWTAPAGATKYEVWRGATDQLAAATLLAETTTTEYIDTPVAGGTAFFYFVRAGNDSGFGGYTGPDAGSTATPPPPFHITNYLQDSPDFIYNELGFLYNGFFPFVYCFSDANWIYIYPQGPDDTTGYFLYDFKRAQFGFTQNIYYPWYFVLPATDGAVVDMNPLRQ